MVFKLNKGTISSILVGSLLNVSQAYATSLPSIGSLTLDLQSNVGVTTNSSGQVTAWADQSGQNHNAVTITNSGPTLLNNQLNGNPELSFSGNNELQIGGSQLLTSQQYTIFTVVNSTTTSSGYQEIISNWAGSNSTTSVFLGTVGNPTSPGVRFTDNYGGNADPVHGGNGIGNIVSPSTPFILTAISNTNNALLYQNNTLLGQDNVAITTRDLTTPYYIGNQGSPLNEYWTGNIAAILVYNSALTNVQQAEVYNYLNSTYLGGSTSAVPEAGEWAMMLLGLPLLGWVVRRKQAAM